MACVSTRESGAIGRDDLAHLVRDFYADVRSDPLLGPVFARAVGARWDAHLDRMTEFWCTVMLKSKSFRGNVYAKHVALREGDDVMPDHFLRWITLWHRQTDVRFAPDVAHELQRTAEGVGRNLFYGFFERFARFIVEGGIAVRWEPVVGSAGPA